jgi:hypothetical protein
MNVFQRILVALTVVLIATGTTHAINEKNHIYRSFWHPMYHGERLNYCSLDGKTCGLNLASQYCKSLGYTHAAEAIKAPNIGLTHFISTSARCRGWECHGFMTISCARRDSHPPAKPYHYREKRFAVPRLNHYRVDFCYETNKQCGRRAANAFCMYMGYAKARHFERETKVLATRTLSQGALCFGESCSGFKNIICYR